MNVKFEPTITTGNIGQMALVALGFGIWLLNGNSKAEQTQQNFAAFQITVSAQLAELKIAVDRRFDNVSAQISSIPTVGVQLAQLDRRISAAESGNSQQDVRLGQAEQAITGLQHDMINIKGASGTLITPGHR